MHLIRPNWSVAQNIHAGCTTRIGGVSQPPFDTFNLASHVGDDDQAVLCNRLLLVEQAKLPQFPLFLQQVHSTKVLELPFSGEDFVADGVYTNQSNQVCLVMTADCLPVLLASEDGKEVAAVHAGWRGLCNGILEACAGKFQSKAINIHVWLGPAISVRAFQVGREVVESFCWHDPNAEQAFISDPQNKDKWFGDLYRIAIQRLNSIGIYHISGGNFCTYSDRARFFSFRRENQTGRMATFIWRE